MFMYHYNLQCLEKLGYNHVLLQIGAGQFQPENALTSVQGVTIDHYKYKPSILEDIQAADLVISHAGMFVSIELKKVEFSVIYNRSLIEMFVNRLPFTIKEIIMSPLKHINGQVA